MQVSLEEQFYDLFHLEASYGYYTRGAFLWTDGCTVVELEAEWLEEQQVSWKWKTHVLNATVAGKLKIPCEYVKYLSET